MSVRGAVVLLAVASVPTTAHGDAKTKRTAIVRLAGPEDAVDEAIAKLRAKLVEHDHEPIGGGELQARLEQPGGPSSADLERASSLLHRAKNSYAQFEYQAALSELAELDQALAGEPGTSQVRELLAERYLLAGLIHHGNGDHDRARRAFRMTRAMEPSRVELDPGLYRPDIVSMYRQSGDISAEETATERRFADAEQTGARSSDLRRPLVTARSSQELAKRAEQLAATIDVSILVLVRIRKGNVEGARFDRATGSLTHWLPIESDRLAGLLDLSPGQEPARRDLLVSSGTQAAQPTSPSWYSTAWGKGLLIAGGLVVGGVLVYAVTAGEGEPTYDLGGWCFEGSCAQ